MSKRIWSNNEKNNLCYKKDLFLKNVFLITRIKCSMITKQGSKTHGYLYKNSNLKIAVFISFIFTPKHKGMNNTFFQDVNKIKI